MKTHDRKDDGRFARLIILGLVLLAANVEVQPLAAATSHLNLMGLQVQGLANQAPTVTLASAQHDVVAHQLFNLRIPSIDPDGDPISFSFGSFPPPGSSISLLPSGVPGNQTGLFSWRPGPADVGSWNVLVLVSDGIDVTTVNLSINVLPASAAVDLTFTTPQGTAPGASWTLDLTAPTMAGAPFVLIVGPELNPGLALPGVFGTGMLGVDPASMVVLMNGLEQTSFNPFTSPFSVSGQIPPGLTGATFSFQGFVVDNGGIFASAPAVVTF